MSMSTITLELDTALLEKAKNWATQNGLTIDELISQILVSISSFDKDKIDLHPDVVKMSGILSSPDKSDYKKVMREYLEEKYG